MFPVWKMLPYMPYGVTSSDPWFPKKNVSKDSHFNHSVAHFVGQCWSQKTHINNWRFKHPILSYLMGFPWLIILNNIIMVNDGHVPNHQPVVIFHLTLLWIAHHLETLALAFPSLWTTPNQHGFKRPQLFTTHSPRSQHGWWVSI